MKQIINLVKQLEEEIVDYFPAIYNRNNLAKKFDGLFEKLETFKIATIQKKGDRKKDMSITIESYFEDLAAIIRSELSDLEEDFEVYKGRDLLELLFEIEETLQLQIFSAY